MTPRRIAGVVACVAAFVPTAAHGAVRYAEPAGNGPAATCPQADPCSIEVAVENVATVDGDEIVVLPGTHSLGGGELVVADDLDIHGALGQPRPVIAGSGSIVVRFGSAGSRLADVSIVGSGDFGLSMSGGLVERVNTALTDHGSACSAYAGTIRDSVCSAVSGNGLQLGLFGPPGSYAINVRNVTALAGAGPSSNGINGTAGPSVTTTASLHNVIADGVVADVRSGTGDPTGEINLALTNSAYQTRVQSGAGFVTAPGAGTNLLEPAQLVNPAAGDFRQLPSSPTIDRGAADPLLGQLDFERQSRVDGSTPDIGADEFQLAPETTITRSPKKKVRTRKRKARFQFRFDANEATQAFSCSRDRKPLQPCTSPFRGKAKLGKHTFEVFATDVAGNVDATPATFKWKVKRKRR